MHKTAEELAALYASARTPRDLAMTWCASIGDRQPMSAQDFCFCAGAYLDRRAWFDQLTGDGERGA